MLVPVEYLDTRLDKALAELCPEFSRENIKTWLLEGKMTLNGQVKKPRDKLSKTGSSAPWTMILECEIQEPQDWIPQALPIEVVFADPELIVINKPAGLTVHPGAGQAQNTLVNALLYQYPELHVLPRGGLVHRIDKDTTGLLVIARTMAAYQNLVGQLQARTIKRVYHSIVMGLIHRPTGTIDTLMGRHPVHRTRMAVVGHGKNAITHYRTLSRFANTTYLEIRLETGRTHQIRVHMQHIGHPIFGDPTYGGRQAEFKRQALHAKSLSFNHPKTTEPLHFEIPLPKDMQALVSILKDQL